MSALCAAAVLLAGCGTKTEAADRLATNLQASDVKMAAAQAGVSYTEVANGTRQLGYQLASLVPDDDGNVVVSPASLAIAFAMAREGATGASADEIDQAFGFGADRQAAYNGLIHELADVGAGSVLENNNAAFVDRNYFINRRYLAAIKRWYGAGVVQTDFPYAALDDINNWVNKHTHGRIPHLLQELDRYSKFALVNTLYLNAKWENPFDPDLISDAAFTTGDGKEVTVDMMKMDDKLDYASGDGWQAVRLPYKGGELSMEVLLPTKGGDPTAMLRPDNLARAESGFSRSYVQLGLPRWDTDTNARLMSVLQQLGLNEAMLPGAFGGITSDPRFGLSDVVQQANVTVGEKGTEGAAATAVIFEVSGGSTAPTMYVDSPFAFVIVHEPTGVPLLEGVVVDPS